MLPPIGQIAGDRPRRRSVRADDDRRDALRDLRLGGRVLLRPLVEWLWMSMKPGARTRPLPSTIDSPRRGRTSPTLAMRSPSMRTLRGPRRPAGSVNEGGVNDRRRARRLCLRGGRPGRTPQAIRTATKRMNLMWECLDILARRIAPSSTEKLTADLKTRYYLLPRYQPMDPLDSVPAAGSAAGRVQAADSSLVLVLRAQEGDERAKNELCARYLPRLKRWARGRLPIWAREHLDTEDIVQETLVRSIAQLEGFSPTHEHAFWAYTCQALRNRLRDVVRRAQRRPPTGELSEEHIADDPSPLELAVGRDTLRRTRARCSGCAR